MHMKVLGNDVEKKISVWLINYKHFLFLSLSLPLSLLKYMQTWFPVSVWYRKCSNINVVSQIFSEFRNKSKFCLIE
jgi:hypothetical protein